MSIPIHAYETTIIIEPELQTKTTHADLSDGAQFTIDQRLNMRSKPIIKVTAHDTLSGFTITNTITNASITYNQELLGGASIIFRDNSAYIGANEVDALYTAPFYIEENAENVIEVSIVGESTVDIEVERKCAGGSGRTQNYVQGFSIAETRNYHKQPVGFLNKYIKKSALQDIGYTFSIGIMWSNSDISTDGDITYRIGFSTDDSDGLEKQVYFLCGCRIENHDISFNDGQMVMENLNGFGCQLIPAPETYSYYFLFPAMIGG